MQNKNKTENMSNKQGKLKKLVLTKKRNRVIDSDSSEEDNAPIVIDSDDSSSSSYSSQQKQQRKRSLSSTKRTSTTTGNKRKLVQTKIVPERKKKKLIMVSSQSLESSSGDEDDEFNDLFGMKNGNNTKPEESKPKRGKIVLEPRKQSTSSYSSSQSTPPSQSSFIEHITWADKYTPQKKEELCMNKDKVTQVEQFFNQFSSNRQIQHDVLIVVGPPGAGKNSKYHWKVLIISTNTFNNNRFSKCNV
jgi:hypothetical protein